MIDIVSLRNLLDIAEKAIAVDDCRSEHLENLHKLKSAYEAHKEKHGISGRVDSASDEWDLIKAATASEYAVVEKSRRAIYNAERRLATAVRKHRHG